MADTQTHVASFFVMIGGWVSTLSLAFAEGMGYLNDYSGAFVSIGVIVTTIITIVSSRRSAHAQLPWKMKPKK